MSKWVEVQVGDEKIMARSWPGGVLVWVYLEYADYQDNPHVIYMPDYRIKMQSGDMDGNRLERVGESPPEYTITLRPNNG